MGGKTQQRVAGNVKPSSSGRIRELLMNKHGVGNIITFSALSTTEQQPASPENQPKNVDDDAPEVVLETTRNNPTTIQASPDAKPTLIVRKVGGRDLYTRVRVVKDSSNQVANPASNISSSQNLASPLKQKTDLLEVENSNDNTGKLGQEVQIADQTGDQTQIADNHEIVPTKDEKRNEVFEFETVLDQLNQIQDSLGRGAAYCLDNLDQKKITQELELLRLLDILIVNFKNELSIEEWDLVHSSLRKWIGMISRTTKKISECQMKSKFCIDVFNFIHKLISLAKSLEKIENLKEEFPMLQSLRNDWNNFQSSDVCQDLIIQYFKLVREPSPNPKHLEVFTALANILVDIEPALIVFSTNLPKYLEPITELDLEFKQPKNTRYCCVKKTESKGFLPMTNLLRSNYREIIVSSHSMLSKIMHFYICSRSEISPTITEQDDIDNLSIFPPVALMSILTSNDAIMSALLSDYRVGDTSVTIEPNTDSYSCVLGYLFAWDLTIQFIVGVDKEIGHRIIHSLKKSGLIQRLLDNVFMLVPPLGERDSLNLKIDSDKNNDDQRWSLGDFLKSPLRTAMRRPSNEIELAALHVYFSVALHMPVTVRKWYNNNSSKKLCNLVNEYTVKHISQVICSLEMDTVLEKCQQRANEDKLNNLVIKARPSAKEVYAIYTRDEFKMELTIKLPTNYPLGSVQIDGGKRVGVTDVKWRSWLLQLTTFLSHQNGPILDGIDLWRRNIDKRFEGIEKCMICFSILHSNYQLPKKKCLTCSKMFHNLCLYKWFETSGNSTCPLCRNAW